jgi:hypothetical protein
MPEYNVGFTILVAEDGRALRWLDNKVIKRAVNGVEKLARKQTAEKYSGFYRSSTLNSSLAFKVNGSSGLVIRSRLSNDTDFQTEPTHLMTGKTRMHSRRSIPSCRLIFSSGGRVKRRESAATSVEVEQVWATAETGVCTTLGRLRLSRDGVDKLSITSKPRARLCWWFDGCPAVMAPCSVLPPY